MRRLRALALIVVLSLIATACGQEVEDVAGTEAVVASAEPVPAEPRTEEELRGEIAALKEDVSALATVKEYYERLLAMDVFTEEDYVALAEIYEAEGAQEAQADMLTKVHRLYPSTEYTEALSALIWDRDSADADVAELAAQMIELLNGENAEELHALITSENWAKHLQNELVGVVTKTRYMDEERTIQISSDTFSTEIMSLSAAGEMLCYKWDGQGAVIVKAVLAEGNYQGEFVAAYFDEENVLQCRYSGTMEQNVCVEELLISYDGREYTGEFDEKGVTLAEQISSETKDGNVIYAYTDNEKNYLYEEDSTVDDFRIDSNYLNLPEYKAW